MTATARQMWELGGYARIGDLIADLGVDLIVAAGVGPGQRVLDIAAGTGNATLPAARRGARVTATDIAPGLMAIGYAAARQEVLTVRRIEADATSLPFGDGEFDVVMSCIGVIFAPDHAAAAKEMPRVCRPGGTIAMTNWTPAARSGASSRCWAAMHRPRPRTRPGRSAGAIRPTWKAARHGLRPATDRRARGHAPLRWIARGADRSLQSALRPGDRHLLRARRRPRARGRAGRRSARLLPYGERQA